MVTFPSVFNYLDRLAAVDAFDAEGVEDAVSGLVSSLRAAVGSFHGLRITIVEHGHPVSLTEFSESALELAASLGVDLAFLRPDADPASRIVLYAGTPGAFVDLAADLRHAFKASGSTRRTPTEIDHADDGAGPSIELDADLPPVSTVSGMVGLAEFSAINRAVGLLIGLGLLPEGAHEALRLGAVTADVEKHVFAALLLGR